MLSVMFLGLSGCSGNDSEAPSATVSRVTLQLRTSDVRGGTQRSLSSAQNRQVMPGDADFIASLEVRIQAPDIRPTIREVFPLTEADQTSVMVQLSVPRGTNRQIRVLAFNEAGRTIFRGQTTVDLTQANEVVQLLLVAENTSPTLVTPGDQINTEGDAVALQVMANDEDGDTLVFSATNLPPGLSLDANSGLISGTLADTAAARSPYTVTVTVQDASASADVTFTWTVILQTTPGTARIGSPDNPVTPGQTFTVQVVVHSDEADILSYLLALTFDPEVVRVTSIANGLAPFDAPVANQDTFASGEVLFAANNSTFAPANGLLNVALITFEVVASSPGVTSDLQLSFPPEGELVGRAFQPLADITLVNGRVRVN